jgi:ribosomal protein L32/ribosomal protein L31
MKPGIHPDYHPVVFRDSSTGAQFLTRSTATSAQTVEWEDGDTYPLLVVDVTSGSHPSWDRHPAADGLSRPGREVQPPLRQARGEALMAVPKRRMSRSNTRSRRARWKATPPNLVPVTIAGRRHLIPRRLVKAYQRGQLDPPS